MAVPSIFQMSRPPSYTAPTSEQLYQGVEDMTLTDAAMTALSLYPATRLGGAAISNAPKLVPYLERLTRAAGFSRKGINHNRAAVTSGLAALGIGGLSGDDAPAVGGDSTGTVPVEDRSMTTAAIDANAEKLKADRGDDTNWFDALNERVDLMAMGAAMLSGSGSGMGTAANLGRGLQAGIASRTGQAKAAEDKQYKDAALLLDSMRARAALQAASSSNELTFRESVDALSSELQIAGADAENTKVISQFMLGRPEMSRFLGRVSGNQRKEFIKDFVSRGQGWVGDKIEAGNVGDAFQNAIDNLKGSK